MPADSTPGQRIMAELRRDPYRSNREIARAARADNKNVGHVRRTLERYGVILPRPPTSAQRAEDELKRHPSYSDRLIAAEIGCDHHVVSHARQRLEAAGVIEPVPHRQRRARPGPRQTGRALQAAAARPDATPKELAAQFGLPYQSAYWALREVARRRPPAAPHADLGQTTALRPPPDWSYGLCTTAPRHQRAWWTSADRDEREAAARMCAGCPVLGPCERWSLALPWSDRDAVYGGMSPAERLRRKRAVRDEIARQALEGIRWP